jgi:hypothetical protein
VLPAIPKLSCDFARNGKSRTRAMAIFCFKYTCGLIFYAAFSFEFAFW